MPAPLDRLVHPTHVNPLDWQSAAPHVSEAEQQQKQQAAHEASSLISYKRVPKACTQCRRDKCRCDRARPCALCIKKGREDMCFDGCVECRQSKLRCDRSRPCTACRENGRECVEDIPVTIAASRLSQAQKKKPNAAAESTSGSPTTPTSTSTSSPISTDDRPIHVRTPETRIKLACVLCRADSKKCAGGDPCPRCRNRNKKCVYLSRAPKLVKQRCAWCRKKNKKCEDVRPCAQCIKVGADCVDLKRKGTGRGKRVKRACAGCRLDKIQCEEVRPCAGCKKKKIECLERDCKACTEQGTKCAPCLKHARLRAEEVEWEDCGSESEDLSAPSLPSSSSPPSTTDFDFPLDPRLYDPPAPFLHSSDALQPKTEYPPAYSPGFYASQTSPGHSSFPDDSGFPSAPSTHAMRPPFATHPSAYRPERLFFSSDPYPPLSLTPSLSDVRTRSDYDEE